MQRTHHAGGPLLVALGIALFLLSDVDSTPANGQILNGRIRTDVDPECGREGLYPSQERTLRIQRELRALAGQNNNAGIIREQTNGYLTSEKRRRRLRDQRQRYENQTPPQTWTVLFYDDADFVNAYDPFADFAADARSDSNVNVLILRDTYGGQAAVYRVDEDHTAVLLEHRGEVNMGHTVTLRDFIMYGKANYPADRYLLALYDHGGGWAGACVDNTNSDWLTMADIARAITQSGGVDIICFTAPCLMGALESTYELRDWVDVYIGSEDLSGYAFWHGIMGDICSTLNDSALLTSNDIAETIIQLVGDNTYWPSEWLTMSAVDASEVSEVARRVNSFFQYALADMGRVYGDVSTARSLTWEMGRGGSFTVHEVDLYDFAAQMAAITTDTLAVRALDDLMAALDRAVLAECHGDSQLRTNGLSIYFPKYAEDYGAHYANASLEFLGDTVWKYFLEAYYDELVPVYVQDYASIWREDHVEVTWVLKEVGPGAELGFEVFRRSGSAQSFHSLATPEVVNNGRAFACRDYTAKLGDIYVYRVYVYENGARVSSFETEIDLRSCPRWFVRSYPNPFSSASTITYSIPVKGTVKLRVYDVDGRLVQTLVDGPKYPGDYDVSWTGRRTDGRMVPSGVYFIRLETRGRVQTHKIAVIR